MQLQAAQTAAFDWIGRPPDLFLPGQIAGNGLRTQAANVIATMPRAIWLGLGIVVLMVVLRLLLRRGWAAEIGFATVIGVLPALQGGWLAGAFGFVAGITWAIVATRYGLLMFSTMVASNFVLNNSGLGSLDAGGVFLAMAVVIAPGVLGFFTATRGRKHTAWLDA